MLPAEIDGVLVVDIEGQQATVCEMAAQEGVAGEVGEGEAVDPSDRYVRRKFSRELASPRKACTSSSDEIVIM